jgi:heterodisulfide reductase subunit B
MQYYEYRELKTYIDKISGYELKEQMDRLVRQYCVSEFDYMYPDRETMWLDMIKRGLAIPEAMKIVKQVCRGCGLSDLMKSKLRNIGYKEEIINEMNECKYLKGRNVGLMKLLYVQNLVGGVV